jgi:Mor family transcriptional regulator
VTSPFVDDLLAAMPTHHARMAAIAVLAKWSGSSVYIPAPSKAERRESAAANMLRNGMDRGEVVRALKQRFGVSVRTAWTDTAKALEKLQQETA